MDLGGTGANICSGFMALGSDIDFICITGNDFTASFLRAELVRRGFSDRYFFTGMDENPLSIIIYDALGRRRINSDHKTLSKAQFPEGFIEDNIDFCSYSLAVVCNVNYNRSLIPWLKKHNIPIATDLHTLSRLDDEYNQQFMDAADIVFLSHENLHMPPEEVIKYLVHEKREHSSAIAVTGLGKNGCLMGIKGHNRVYHFEAPDLRPVKNTVGAGDALFSGFLHFFNKTGDPFYSMQRAQVFASWKTGESGACKGFLSEHEVESKLREFIQA
jgi:ribokinase